ncbi:unnamed protein product [Clavelina lepadiformis]|uniref:G-protein coupled receptors family 1 profile domain-containing protein n=1 Tax=Clavelina lepadiformis TaxID=159417 RepID=A0ABP0GAQ9_CLALP
MEQIRFLFLVGFFSASCGQMWSRQWCHYHYQRCGPTQFNCACEFADELFTYESECVPWLWVCDGETDCSNGKDEKDCFCGADQFQCSLCDRGDRDCREVFQCIERSDVCDGSESCVTARDEYGGFCDADAGFRCDTGRYIMSAHRCNGQVDCRDGSDEFACSETSCQEKLMKCDCNKNGNYSCSQEGKSCYHEGEVCDGMAQCSDGTDEQFCPMLCPTYLPLPCECNRQGNYSCTGAGPICYSPDDICDGAMTCQDGTDERDCANPCPGNNNLPCDCNQRGNNTCRHSPICFPKSTRCDAQPFCGDYSDEQNCTCPDDKVACFCFRSNFPTCDAEEGCVSRELINDGKLDCESGSDETYIKRHDKVQCGTCQVHLYRLENQNFCHAPWCDSSSCHNITSREADANNVTSDVLCTSFCPEVNGIKSSCNEIMECSDGSLVLGYNFCNGIYDCDDASDEAEGGFGFKCSPVPTSPVRCVLPQQNLYDVHAQCYDQSDLCFLHGVRNCFRCLDNRLIIASAQVCDGEIDCHDLSDECLCDRISLEICFKRFSKAHHVPDYCRVIFVDSARAFNASTAQFGGDESSSDRNPKEIHCSTKWGNTLARQCDGRPECSDFSDECISCPNTPRFCSDPCRFVYPIGDRYCDGFADEAWRHLNDSNCPQGFDEHDCPMRFECQAGTKVSIDAKQHCDGLVNCDDHSDEVDCDDRYYCDTRMGGFVSIPLTARLDGKQDCIDGSDEFKPTIFSSATEMIANIPLLAWFSIAGFSIIIGNLYVAILSVVQLRQKDQNSVSKCTNMFIFSLAVSDCLMGVYLVIISAKAIELSGRYSLCDYAWRTGVLCSLAGSLCMISSQTSCFIMTILTAHRLYAVLHPFKARRANRTVWTTAIVAAWACGLSITVASNTATYFKPKLVARTSAFSNRDTVVRGYLIEFACRLAALTNKTIELSRDNLKSSEDFLKGNFPEFAPIGVIGYYGSTSVCMPRLFVSPYDNFWAYSISVVTINLAAFIFMVVGNIVVCVITAKSSLNIEQVHSRNKKVQARVARIIFTDFLCWIPICVMSYVSVCDVRLFDDVEILTVGLLLPINSLLNPILYSPLIENKLKRWWRALCSVRKIDKKSGSVLRTIT